ncbi:MAG TPA: LPS export ABC transporter periplasmic protein LptC [Mucilaginibacter sp.]|nr:LPS export ABC transporter periplasmic protein LptC [Mucilaginibacter sp.]
MAGAKQISVLFLPALITLTLLTAGCENDLRDIKKISASEVNKPLEEYTGVDVLYSDSAYVKAHLTAPLMLDYDKLKNPYIEMPKGVKVVFYDKNMQQTCTITADYGIRHEKEKLIELRKNVVGTNAKGETFNSDELIWDEGSKMIHSDKLVHVRMADGSLTDGTSFVSDENLEHWKLNQATGIIHVNSQDVPQQ